MTALQAVDVVLLAVAVVLFAVAAVTRDWRPAFAAFGVVFALIPLINTLGAALT